MGRKTVPQPLALDPTAPSDGTGVETHALASPPLKAKSPKSPRSPFRFHQKKSPPGTGCGSAENLHPDLAGNDQAQAAFRDAYTPLSSLLHRPLDDQRASPPLPKPQKQSTRPQPGPGHSHNRQDQDKASKSGFFFNFKSAKTAERPGMQPVSDPRHETMSRDGEAPVSSKQNTNRIEDPSYAFNAVQRLAPTQCESNLSRSSSTDHDTSSKKSRQKPFTVLTRSRSVKDNASSRDTPSPNEPPPLQPSRTPEPEGNRALTPLRAAAGNLPLRDMTAIGPRIDSAERPHADRSHSRDGSGARSREQQERDNRAQQPSSLREIFHGKAGHFFRGFAKGPGNGSPEPREPTIDDEHYQLKVINLPLVEQTRITRISKRLEESRDKTEFWMPAFPWRAIDYLNYKGSDVEGLYRVPGSGPQIKKWQRKFDEELDVDLFAQDDLYDINIVGSMLKAWLRELPDELLSKEAQDRVAKECSGSEKVPPQLIEELANLSPFKYYLLFAITCHLSLLLAHSDKNKMDFRNLCICFQPCMKIDACCFKFLVCDWRDCWKGCRSEARYIEEEYAFFDQPPPRGIADFRLNDSPERGRLEDRDTAPTDKNPVAGRNDNDGSNRIRKKSGSANGGTESTSSYPVNLTIQSEREVPTKKSGNLRPLSPIKPLSPMGF